MKTRKQTLEAIYDSFLEDKLKMEVAIRNLDDRKDDDIVGYRWRRLKRNYN